MDRTEIITAICLAFRHSQRCPKIAQRFNVVRTITGATCRSQLDEKMEDYHRGSAYYVFITTDGTTYEPRAESVNELELRHKARVDRDTADLRAKCEKMSDERLRQQADYWLAGV